MFFVPRQTEGGGGLELNTNEGGVSLALFRSSLYAPTPSTELDIFLDSPVQVFFTIIFITHCSSFLKVTTIVTIPKTSEYTTYTRGT